jgi:hypothetical protein
MTHDNYLSRKNQLLRAFDKSLSRVKRPLEAWLGIQQTNRLIQESRLAYDDLIPRIPFIGNKNPLLIFFWPTTRYLAVYRALQSQGLTIDDAGRLTLMIGTQDLRAVPFIARRFMSTIWFSPWFKARIQKREIKTQQRRYPGDFVINYIQGDGREFDYGVDYIECANCKLLKAERAFELAPYLCAVDKPASELLGWGLTRTMTLAEGFYKCDFRFKKGGPTHVAVPPSLQAIIEPELN